MDMNNFAKLASLNEQIKELTKQADAYKKLVKADMTNEGIYDVTENGTSFHLAESSRTTCADKTGFMKFLASKGLKHCLNAVYEPNFDRAKDEIVANRLSQEEYDKFVKTSPVLTLTIK